MDETPSKIRRVDPLKNAIGSIQICRWKCLKMSHQWQDYDANDSHTPPPDRLCRIPPADRWSSGRPCAEGMALARAAASLLIPLSHGCRACPCSWRSSRDVGPRIWLAPSVAINSRHGQDRPWSQHETDPHAMITLIVSRPSTGNPPPFHEPLHVVACHEHLSSPPFEPGNVGVGVGVGVRCWGCVTDRENRRVS